MRPFWERLRQAGAKLYVLENVADSPTSAEAVDPALCYHCGLPLAQAGDSFAVVIDGRNRPMCCGGCRAVAQAIVDNGLTDYYRHRDALPDSPREALPAALKDLGLFDHPQVQQGFVRQLGGDEREAALLLEGITCAACVWLNESHLARQPGVLAVDINYATRRARVRWDDRRIKLSGILRAVAAIGYRAHPYDAGRSEQLAAAERRAALWRLAVAGLGMMQVMMYALPAYLADEGSMSEDIAQLMRWAGLVLTLPVVCYSGAPFFRGSWRDLRLRRVGMDVPVALGVGAAFVASVWATFTGTGEVYFDSVTMFLFFLLCGRYLETMARQRAVRGVERLDRVLPAFATRFVRHPESDCETVPVAALAPADVVLVKPGEAFPVDGVVLAGESRVDESLLTGESRPLSKRVGDAVTGGALNCESPLAVRVERVGEATRLAQIRRLMESAAGDKPALVQMADRVALWFVLGLLVVAGATGVYWWLADPGRALPIFVAVLVVSCPCALSLATPAALTSATGALSGLGVLVARAHAVETLARATHFVFDKTGTLTAGRMRLVESIALSGVDAAQALCWAAALERGSEHAIGAGLARAAPQDLPEVSELRAVPGQGLEGVVAGRRLRIGRPEFAGALHARPLPAGLPEDGDTRVFLADADGWLCVFRLADELRPGAAELARSLRDAGVRTTILSGDAESAVRAVAQSLCIEDARGGLTPEDKHRAILELQAAGAVVAMVGDGVNDAPVLAQAQVSVAMGGGTELARMQGDLVLLGDHLGQLAAAVRLARRSLRVIRQNLAWAFAYNLAALPLAMAGYVTPWMAGIGMSASSLLVVVNALRLQDTRPRPGAPSIQAG